MKASELTGSLLQSIASAPLDQRGRPFIPVPDGREWSGVILFGGLKDALRLRSDYAEIIGVALQYVVKERGDVARLALDDLLNEDPYVVLALLEWLTPLAVGKTDDLAKRIAELQVRWDEAEETGIAIRWHDPKTTATCTVSSEAELEHALRMTAQHGWVCAISTNFVEPGPWSWLRIHAHAHRWLPAATSRVIAKIAQDPKSTKREMHAMLDYFQDRFDLWRHRDLFTAWAKKPPPWWTDTARVRKPTSWFCPIRWNKSLGTLGDVASAAHATADEQAATPPELDLVPLH